MVRWSYRVTLALGRWRVACWGDSCLWVGGTSPTPWFTPLHLSQTFWTIWCFELCLNISGKRSFSRSAKSNVHKGSLKMNKKVKKLGCSNNFFFFPSMSALCIRFQQISWAVNSERERGFLDLTMQRGSQLCLGQHQSTSNHSSVNYYCHCWLSALAPHRKEVCSSTCSALFYRLPSHDGYNASVGYCQFFFH